MARFDFSTTNGDILKEFGDHATGKTILITGPTEGSLGAQAAIFLATANPAEIILAGRNEANAQSVIDNIKSSSPDIKVTFVQIDLANLSSVRAAAKQINDSVDHIDILINNAGVMAVKKFTKSPDGIELQFAINHIGHFLLTNLILSKIFASPNGARIVNLTSDSYTLSAIRFEDVNFQDGKVYDPFLAYGQSKTANILFTQTLAKRLAGKGVSVIAANPGMVSGTGLAVEMTPEMAVTGYKMYAEAHGGNPPALRMKDPASSCNTALIAALDPSLRGRYPRRGVTDPALIYACEGLSGHYLSDCVVSDEFLMDHATGSEAGEKLWSLSEQLVGEKS